MGYETNPGVISAETVGSIVRDLGEFNPSGYLEKFYSRFRGTQFYETLTMDFQVFRIGHLGFQIVVDPADREKFGLQIEALGDTGPESSLAEDVPDEEFSGLDFLVGVNIMRGFVGSAFYEQAKTNGLSEPLINKQLIDPPPVKRVEIGSITASKPGLFLFEQEAMEVRIKEENGPLYEETIRLVGELAACYSNRFSMAWMNSVPPQYLEKIAPEIEEQWRDCLVGYALRTYAMLTPTPPDLIEVTTISPREKQV